MCIEASPCGDKLYRPLVSIVIPTYNEEEDIEKCLTAVLSLDYDNKEIIVVDSASTDNTPKILQKYEKERLIKVTTENERRGVALARNLGIYKSRGEIIVLLNADVILKKEFINEILKHYANGADFVVCESKVLNDSQLIPAYIQAVHELSYSDRSDLVWSEGFSCKKEALLNVGGFNFFPRGSAGEDATLGFKLEKKYKRVLDRSIIVPHIVSTKLTEFLKQRYERGKGVAFFKKYYLDEPVERSLFYIFGILFAITFLLFIYPINMIMLLGIWFILRNLIKGYLLSKTNINYIFFFTILSMLDFISSKIGFIEASFRILMSRY